MVDEVVRAGGWILRQDGRRLLGVGGADLVVGRWVKTQVGSCGGGQCLTMVVMEER